MKNQIINNGLILLEKDNLVHLMNRNNVSMVFQVVSIDNGYVVLEPMDHKKFNGDAMAIDKFCTGKPIIKGLVEYGNRIK